MKQLDHQQVTARASVAPPVTVDAETPRSRGRFVALGVLLVGAAVVGGACFLATTRGLAVRRIVVEGAVHADPRDLARASGALGENLLALDLAAARARVLAQPWVEEATLRRVLPHELQVRVSERVPIAREQDGEAFRVLDARGVVLDENVDESERGLPLLVGAARASEDEHVIARERAAATLGALLAEAPALFGRIESIDASQPDRLVILAEGAPPLWMRGPESADEVAAWLLRERGLARRLGEAAYVDARWRDRLYIMPSGGGGRPSASLDFGLGSPYVPKRTRGSPRLVRLASGHPALPAGSPASMRVARRLGPRTEDHFRKDSREQAA
jgi:hypothetical protein